MFYYFILGQNPKLSTAEISAVLQQQGLNFKIVKYSNEILLVDLPKEIAAESLLDQLGGTIKIGEILTNATPNKITPEFLTSLLTADKQNPKSKIQNPKLPVTDYRLPVASSKFHFGFSTYQISVHSPQSTVHSWKLTNSFGLGVKRLLKENGVSSRLVIDKAKTLSSVTVAKNRLLKNGAEICFLVDDKQIYLGKTLAVQKFGEYSKFDYGRPGRDPHSGMLPPKVAKMMLNLSQSRVPSPQSRVLDPFCGSGTILQEAARLGYTNLIGSDISAKAIKDTKNNFEFINRESLYGQGTALPLHVLDVRDLSSQIKPSSINAIVTEPFLGPALRGYESATELKKIISELSELYLTALAEFKKVLKPHGRLTIIFPIINGQPSISDQQLLQIKKLGFSPSWNLPAELDFILSPRGSITYSRPGQRVEREIFVWELGARN